MLQGQRKPSQQETFFHINKLLFFPAILALLKLTVTPLDVIKANSFSYLLALVEVKTIILMGTGRELHDSDSCLI